MTIWISENLSTILISLVLILVLSSIIYLNLIKPYLKSKNSNTPNKCIGCPYCSSCSKIADKNSELNIKKSEP